MPTKLEKETQAEQSERFKKVAQDMINAGELDPAEAEGVVSRLLSRHDCRPSQSNPLEPE